MTTRKITPSEIIGTKLIEEEIELDKRKGRPGETVQPFTVENWLKEKKNENI